MRRSNNLQSDSQPQVEAPVETENPIVEQPQVEAPVDEVPEDNIELQEAKSEIERLKEQLANVTKAPELAPYKPPVQVTGRTAKPDIDEDGNTYGNQDKEKKYKFPVGWLGAVVVSQFNVETMGSGTKQVDEGSRRTMPYDVAVFNKLVKDQGFEDLQYFILHDPR